MVGEERSSRRSCEAGRVEEVLDGEGDAVADNVGPSKEDPFELGHSFGALSTPTGAEISHYARLGEEAAGETDGNPHHQN